MSGAVAAGNRHSAEAGAWALREGGTAVDAALASTFAAFVAEGPLTGPAGGGFLMLKEPGLDTVSLDCFFAVPSRPPEEMDEVVIDFGDASTQVFHIGEASVAVPGLLAGLEDAHTRRGRLPWERLFVPALELAHRGVAPDAAQAFLLEILVPILQREPAGRRIYGSPGRIDGRELVGALNLIRDARSEAIAVLLPELAADIAGYGVRACAPLDGSIGAATVLTTPEPSRGGDVIRTGLEALDERGDDASGSAAEARSLAAALAAGYGAGPTASAGARPTGTTNVSVIDADGAAVALSSTLGSGSGVFRHGFQLNNMLGELDVIGDEVREPGTRLPSMMAPTLVLVDGEPRLVVGSAGSVRLAGAILQVVAGVVRQGLPVEDAIARPRLHVDGSTVHVEGGWPKDVAGTLADDGFEPVVWAASNLFFGGASAVERRPNGTLGAAGDPRRGGYACIVR